MTSTWPDTGSGEILGGRYRLAELVGSGGMASVHRAHDLVLDRDVAVKVFRTDVSEAADYRRIQAEIKMLGSVNHPNLVTLHDASLSDDLETAYLVMELVDGEDLGHLLAERRVSARDAVRIGAQIASALAHIHRKGIVHRDVKPANILVRRDQDGRVWAKLADLGIARIADATHLTTAGTMLGTVAYLSPEQVAGGYIDSASDVYALGLVLIEALTGLKPFPGTPSESAAMRTVRQPDLPVGLPEMHRGLLGAMTTLDPSTRISAAQAEEALSRWEALTGVVTRNVPLPQAGQPGDETGPQTQAMPSPYLPPETGPQFGATAPVAGPSYGAAPGTGPQFDPTVPFTGQYGAPTTGPQFGPTQHMMAPATNPSTWLANVPAGTGTVPLRTGPQSTGSVRVSEQQKRRARTVAIVMWVVVAVLLVAAAIVAPMVISALNPEPASSSGTAGSPTYPAVDGEIGTALKDLQEAVK
ncbi:serine/threonine-protein kinase [Naasia aerilata]|uniref:non-specific serine/threonine protein kinase n=1 Tax=Naasia aerilata TaxID=1162966 RepID=A0ABN6XK90_9MICO|nr:serine/threonine-protein kinase [Naasia aerilata]BDZ44162.1 serine/threonine protein kinase [Naasia aerilata]